uniref:Uncharacterized protein n=2 Tax=Alexandrium monilatum TaxID=311494 RepID=A0A7S4Q010_9DINO
MLPLGAARLGAVAEGPVAPGTSVPEALEGAPAALEGPQPVAAAGASPPAAVNAIALQGGSSADVEAGAVQEVPSTSQSSLATSTASGSGLAAVVRREVTSRSLWRWPSQPGKLPSYVEGNFRVKTFGLLTIQFVVVLVTMVLVEVYLPLHTVFRNTQQCHAISVAVGIATLIVLTILYCLKDRYPVNYVLLMVVTLLVGFYWGMGYMIFSSRLHFQLVGIMGIGALVATCLSAYLSYLSKMDGWCVVLTSVYVGWAAGCIVDMTIVRHFPGFEGHWEFVAALVAFFLFSVLILDVGNKLAFGNPDDFMRVIISMDSALLVVVSIPISIISACLLHTDNYPEILGGAARRGEQRERHA